jgi:hypothetical protein
LKYRFIKKIFGLTILMLICACLVSCEKKPETTPVLNNNAQNLNPVNQMPNEVISDKFEKKVIISVENRGRLNPFLPYCEKSIVLSKMPNFNTTINTNKLKVLEFSDLPLPPSIKDKNSQLGYLIQAKVTGILYDRYKPTAIINVMGEDYLVRKGSKVSEFYIQDIKKDYVIIKSGFNTYKTSIGEIVDAPIAATTNTATVNNFDNFSRASSSSDKIEIKPIPDLRQTNPGRTFSSPPLTPHLKSI